MFSTLSSVGNVPAQELIFQRNVKPFSVRVPDRDGVLLALDFPFLGGFNAPRPQFVDIDGDSDLDLFVLERRDALMFFKNGGSPQTPQLQWITDNYSGIMVGIWFKFIDIDGDNDLDLFTETPFNLIRLFRNDGTPFEPQFVVAADTLRDLSDNALFFDFASAPDFADIDCDQDADLFIGRQTGTISHYENTGLDANGVPRFAFVTDHFQEISIVGESPPQMVAESPQTQTHGANSLTFADNDDDNDPDLFWGDFFEPSLVFLENSGSCTEPGIAITTRRFPVQAPLLSGGFNAPRFADIDADGDLDLFVGILGGAFLGRQDAAANFYFYRNLGSAQEPIYELLETQFLATIDIGTSSLPTLVDIDSDGDLDLFLANEEDPTEFLQSHLYFFENQGGPESPTFALADSNFIDFSLGFNLAPAFVDIDNDGDQDLFLGDSDGRLNLVENTGSPAVPQFTQVEEDFDEIDVGNNCTPAFTDIDADGDFDMFLGELLGTISFYQNLGSPEVANFVLATENFADIRVGLYSTPAFYDIDRDGDQDLFVGSEVAGLFFFRNSGSPQAPEFVADQIPTLAVNQRSAPFLADIDADGDADFFSGDQAGGLLFYENRDIVSSISPQQPRSVIPEVIGLLQNYPNPFNPSTTISYRLTLADQLLGQTHTLTIYNLLGRPIRHWRIQNERIDQSGSLVWAGRDHAGNPVASGVYVYELLVNSKIKLRKKMLLIR